MLIDINGIPTNYIVEGKNDETVLILPGWGATSNVYNLIIKQLAEHYTVYALDLPGFGITPEPPEPWSVGDYADFVTMFIEKCKLTKIILVGHSYGGRIIFNLCERKNAFDIVKIILIDSAGIKSPLSKEQLKKQKRYKKIKSIFQTKALQAIFPNAITYFQKKFGSSDYAGASPLMRQTLVKSISEDYTSSMSKIEVETLLIWGDCDDSTPLSNAITMNKLIKNSTLEIIEGAGHFPFIEQPFAFINVLKKHLSLSQ